LSALVLPACGSYDQPDTATGGASGTGGTATGGASGTGGTATGGTGGSGGQVSCTDVAACGGDVVGTWTVAACPLTVTGTADLTGLGLDPDCMSGPVTGSLQVSGTFTAVAGGTYMDNTSTTGETQFDLISECLELSGTRTTCDEIDGPLISLGFTALVCIDNAMTGGCSCTGTINQTGGLAFVSFDAATSGTYTTAGNTLVTTAFSNDTEYPYCVAANTLTMTLQSVARVGTVMGPIVLQKQ
jgi:hypothetical protein